MFWKILSAATWAVRLKSTFGVYVVFSITATTKGDDSKEFEEFCQSILSIAQNYPSFKSELVWEKLLHGEELTGMFALANQRM